MTLQVMVAMFYSSLKNIPIRLGYRVIRLVDYGEGIQKPEAIEWLNQAADFIATDLGGLKGYYNDTLVINQSEYVLPDDVLKVHRVRLLDGKCCLSIMIPTEPTDVMGRDATGEIPAGIPHSCSVVQMRLNDNSPAARVMKFDCPPCWGAANSTDGSNHDIEFYASVRPQFIDKDAQEFDLPRPLDRAIVFYACYMKTNEPRFLAAYNDSRNAWLRTGADLHPLRPRELLRESINASSRFYY